jgi:uncharacterized protein
MYYLLIYAVVENYVAARQPFREEHLQLARAAADRGELLLGGACGDPVDGALLVFQGTGPEVAEAFVRSDPYVAQGLITGWSIRPWNVVAGSLLPS